MPLKNIVSFCFPMADVSPVFFIFSGSLILATANQSWLLVDHIVS